jgi:hypothetical protein
MSAKWSQADASDTAGHESRLLAGVLLILLPTVMFGGVSILSLLIGDPSYTENPLRQDLWRAGHAHAGVWLILALVALRCVDEAKLSNAMKRLVRGATIRPLPAMSSSVSSVRRSPVVEEPVTIDCRVA